MLKQIIQAFKRERKALTPGAFGKKRHKSRWMKKPYKPHRAASDEVVSEFKAHDRYHTEYLFMRSGSIRRKFDKKPPEVRAAMEARKRLHRGLTA